MTDQTKLDLRGLHFECKVRPIYEALKVLLPLVKREQNAPNLANTVGAVRISCGNGAITLEVNNGRCFGRAVIEHASVTPEPGTILIPAAMLYNALRPAAGRDQWAVFKELADVADNPSVVIKIGAMSTTLPLGDITQFCAIPDQPEPSTSFLDRDPYDMLKATIPAAQAGRRSDGTDGRHDLLRNVGFAWEEKFVTATGTNTHVLTEAKLGRLPGSDERPMGFIGSHVMERDLLDILMVHLRRAGSAKTTFAFTDSALPACTGHCFITMSNGIMIGSTLMFAKYPNVAKVWAQTEEKPDIEFGINIGPLKTVVDQIVATFPGARRDPRFRITLKASDEAETLIVSARDDLGAARAQIETRIYAAEMEGTLQASDFDMDFAIPYVRAVLKSMTREQWFWRISTSRCVESRWPEMVGKWITSVLITPLKGNDLNVNTRTVIMPMQKL